LKKSSEISPPPIPPKGEEKRKRKKENKKQKPFGKITIKISGTMFYTFILSEEKGKFKECSDISLWETCTILCTHTIIHSVIIPLSMINNHIDTILKLARSRQSPKAVILILLS